MDPATQRRLATGAMTYLFILMGYLFFRVLDVSTKSALTFPLRFPNLFLVLRAESGMFETLGQIFGEFLLFAAPFVPIVIGLTVLVIYGRKYGEDVELGLLSSGLAAFTGTLILMFYGFEFQGFSLTLILFSIGVAVCGLLSTGLGETYAHELDKWRRYRVGSNSMGRMLTIINLAIIVSVMISLGTDLGYYENTYKGEIKTMITYLMPETTAHLDIETLNQTGVFTEEMLQQIQRLPPEQREQILQELQNELEVQKSKMEIELNSILDSDKVRAMIDFSLLMVVVVIWSVLDLLKSLVFSPFAGLLTTITAERNPVL
ncbi:MAG: hypothetical protein DRP11_02795 [Candidatus Aenigmatarchaeota archaeon]|nr:MAG: hypothetical protein DRP11_02795 [Candidatus Aenigmarchaeota archaeon]